MNNIFDSLKSATKMTPLQLNGIKLDVKHTVLTPDYLDNLAREKANTASSEQ